MIGPESLQDFGLPFWLDLQRPAFATLDQDTTAEAVVIGSGVAGLKIARLLDQHGVQTIILEAGQAGDGASSRNQGTINHGPGLTYPQCIARYSREVAGQLWQLGLTNHQAIKDQIAQYQIDCDYQVDGSTTLVREDRPGWEEQLADDQRQYELLREDGFDVSFLDRQQALESGGSPLCAGGLRYNTDAQLHSGKYVLGLAEKLVQSTRIELFEDARVASITRTGNCSLVKTEKYSITTPLVFLSTNALVPQFIPDLEIALRAERGQVLVTESLPARPCRGSFGTALAWWREILEPDGRFRLLFGGGRERDEPDSLFPQYQQDGQPHPLLEQEGFRPSLAHQQRLDSQLALLFPQLAGASVTHRWGGLQSFTADYLPQAGLLDAERNIYGIAGFGGRGNCHSDVGAEFLVAQALRIETAFSRQFAALIESLLQVRREGANWGPWTSAYQR
jgi:gamma-glutamylputrescine oxidase